MARKKGGNRGWLTCLVIAAAAVVVVIGCVVFVRYFREPVAQVVGQRVVTPTPIPPTAPPPPSPSVPPPTVPPSAPEPARTPTTRPAASATPSAARPTATPNPRVTPSATLSIQGAASGDMILFVEPESGRTPVLKGIELAQRSVDMVMYLLLDTQIVDGLIAAQQRGVAVRVMHDPNPFGGGDIEPQLTRLRQAGVQVKESNPTFRFTHQKTMLVDSRVAYIMTLNQSSAAFTRNRGYGLIDADAGRVAEIQTVFNADWNRTRPTIQHPDLVWSPDSARDKLIPLLASATRTLDIQAEVMADDEVIATLIEREKRGVRVRVIMSPPEPGSTSEEGLAKLSQNGVEVRLVRTPYIHAKLILVDGVRGWFGSINFSANSLDNNRELGILVRDAPIIRTLSSTFDRDWGPIN